MDRKHWRDGELSLSHGNIIQRSLFTKEGTGGDGARDAVLRYLDSLAWGVLEAGVCTSAHVNEGTQEVFFVAGGTGKLTTPGGEWRLQEGDGALIPPGVEHVILNDGTDPLEFYIVVESVPAGGGAAEILVRNYRESDLLVSHWSYLVHPIFGQQDGLVEMRDILVVRVDPQQTGDMHGHGPNMDEVWSMWKGASVHVVGREACVQDQGTSISVRPCDPGHSLINHTEQPAYLFYCCSIDRNV
jgi:mannose-6-phosphate isomerase-like protein (cupin superfamily)